MDTPNKTKRYSVRCSLCKSRFTTELTEAATVAAHTEKCERFAARLAARIEQGKRIYRNMSLEGVEAAERYQMRALYLRFDVVKGVKVDTVPCDARCTGARGHNCECSCGGANHGSANALR